MASKKKITIEKLPDWPSVLPVPVGSRETKPIDARYIAFLKTGENATAEVTIDIQERSSSSFVAVIKVQVNSNSHSFKVRLLETREFVYASRAEAEFDSLKKALEICVDYMGRY